MLILLIVIVAFCIVFVQAGGGACPQERWYIQQARKAENAKMEALKMYEGGMAC